jgi:ribonuclease P protein component
VKKPDALRGRGSFRDVLAQGRRIEGVLLRCSFTACPDPAVPLRVGFRVSAKRYNAVRRNRIKRLLREAVRLSAGALSRRLEETRTGVSLVVTFKGSEDLPIARLKLCHIRTDVEMFCAKIAATLS